MSITPLGAPPAVPVGPTGAPATCDPATAGSFAALVAGLLGGGTPTGEVADPPAAAAPALAEDASAAPSAPHVLSASDADDAEHDAANDVPADAAVALATGALVLSPLGWSAPVPDPGAPAADAMSAPVATTTPTPPAGAVAAVVAAEAGEGLGAPGVVGGHGSAGDAGATPSAGPSAPDAPTGAQADADPMPAPAPAPAQPAAPQAQSPQAQASSQAAATMPVAPTAPASPLAATAQAEPQRPASPVAQVVPEVTRLVSRGNGVHRLTMRLQPEALGEVRVTLTVRDGAVQVHLSGGDDAARALADGAPELRRVLEMTGATDARVVVRDISGQTAGTASQTSYDTRAGAGGDSSAYGGDAGQQDQHARTRGGAGARDGLTDGATVLRPEPVTAARPGIDLTM